MRVRNEVGAHGREDIDERATLDCMDRVGDVSKCQKTVAHPELSRLCPDSHAKASRRDPGYLAVRMMMKRAACAGLEVHAHEHQIIGGTENLPANARGDVLPRRFRSERECRQRAHALS